jgi:hypothetical protein
MPQRMDGTDSNTAVSVHGAQYCWREEGHPRHVMEKYSRDGVTNPPTRAKSICSSERCKFRGRARRYWGVYEGIVCSKLLSVTPYLVPGMMVEDTWKWSVGFSDFSENHFHVSSTIYTAWRTEIWSIRLFECRRSRTKGFEFRWSTCGRRDLNSDNGFELRQWIWIQTDSRPLNSDVFTGSLPLKNWSLP